MVSTSDTSELLSSPDGGFLSQQEERILALAAVVGFQGSTQSEAESVCEWANGVRLRMHLLDLILDGAVVPIGFRNGSPLLAAIEKVLSAAEVDSYHHNLRLLTSVEVQAESEVEGT